VLAQASGGPEPDSVSTARFPYKIGYDASGTVVAVGSAVKSFDVGDEVYSRVPSVYRGTVAEYAVSIESATALKPPLLTHTEAASIPLAALTSLQSMRRADAALPGGLAGKTVLVPAALSGTGSAAVQLALAVFGAARVVATVSTAKLARAAELLGTDARLQLVDYTAGDVIAAVGRGTVDFFFDTQGLTVAYLPLVKPGSGVIRTISMLPSGSAMAQMTTGDQFPTWLRYTLDLADWFYRWWVGRRGVAYAYDLMTPSGRDLEDLSRWVQEGKFRPIVGRTAKLSDVKSVREACGQVFDGKGGIGKFVIEID
jgi:NADPH:quinone reductase-like Zn-dependent oxidoreductase